MTKTLSVDAIKNGTVIDHIFAGQGLRIVKLLKKNHHNQQVTIGLNLPSKTFGYKDLIKIQNRTLTETEANEIAVFSPDATINIIKNFEITKKIKTDLPDTINNILICSNQNCISNHEKIGTCFFIKEKARQIKLQCHFCEKIFHRDEITEYVL